MIILHTFKHSIYVSSLKIIMRQTKLTLKVLSILTDGTKITSTIIDLLFINSIYDIVG